MNSAPNPKRLGLYGALYLDRGEGMATVRDQLKDPRDASKSARSMLMRAIESR